MGCAFGASESMGRKKEAGFVFGVGGEERQQQLQERMRGSFALLRVTALKNDGRCGTTPMMTG